MRLSIRSNDIECFALLIPSLLLLMTGVGIGSITVLQMMIFVVLGVIGISGFRFLFTGLRATKDHFGLVLVSILLAIPFALISIVAFFLHANEGPYLHVVPNAELVIAMVWLNIAATRDWESFQWWGLFCGLAFLVLVGNLVPAMTGSFSLPYEGLTVHKNNLGLGSAFLLVLTAYVFRITTSNNLRLLAGLNFLLASVLLGCSLSRASLILGGVTIGGSWLFYWLRFVKQLPIFLLFGLVVFNLVFPFFYLQQSADSVGETDAFGRQLYNGREVLWPLALEEIKSRPIFGHGKAFRAQTASWNDATYHSHNLFLQATYHGGAVCLVVLVLYVGWLFQLTGKNALSKRNVLLFSFLVGSMLHACFEICMLFQYQYSTTMWTIIGMGVAAACRSDTPESELV